MATQTKVNPLNRKARGVQIFSENGYKMISFEPLLLERNDGETKTVVMVWGSPFFPKFQDEELGFFNRISRIKRAFNTK